MMIMMMEDGGDSASWKKEKGTKLPPVEAPGRKRSRYFTAQESRRDIVSPPLKAESNSLPSLHKRASLLSYKPIVVTFVRNGDKFFEGVKVNISQRNMRSWENLLSELSRRIDLPAGVRNIYTPEGGHRIKSLSQLEDKKTYVCGSMEPFKRIDYFNVKNPDWKMTRVRVSESEPGPSIFSVPPPCDRSLSSTINSYSNLDSSVRNWMESSKKPRKAFRRASQNPNTLRLDSVTDCQHEAVVKSPEELLNQSTRSISLNISTSSSQHKVLTIYRNAPIHCRECVKVYLNKHMIKSWQDAVRIIGENLKTINGYLRLYNLEGKEIESLSQLWSAGSNLIAVGREKFNLSDFLRGTQENSESGEMVSDKAATLSNSGNWSAPSLTALPETSHVSPKKMILKSHPLPVIQETLPSEIKDSRWNQDPQELQKTTPIAVTSDTSKDKVMFEDDSGRVEMTAIESTSSGKNNMPERKPELPEQEPKSGKDQPSSESDILDDHITKDIPAAEKMSPSDEDMPTLVNANNHHPAALETEESATEEQDSNERNIQDDKTFINNENHNTLYPSDHEHAIEDKTGMSTSSSDVSLPNRRGSMYVNHTFPPSPSSVELSTPEPDTSEFRRKKRRKSLSLLQELQNGCMSRMSESSSLMDLQTSPQRVLHRGHELPHTPLSEVSLGVVQSVVDMVLQRDDCSDSSLMSESPFYENPPKTRRSIAIQTNYADDQLHTTVDNEETLSENDHSVTEHKRSRKDFKNISLDASMAASPLYKKARDRYKVGMVIEEGSFAAVKSCFSKDDGRDFLLRVIQKGKIFGRDDKIMQEIKIMRMLRNENVMGMVDYWETSKEHCMVMEHIEGGDLYDAILHCQHFSEVDARSAARQMGHALVYLHANMIVHRNIKPENIFLTLESNGTWTLKLAGFSLATIATEPLTLECGNEYYRAPEMSSGQGYGAKADVWSVGIITYILLSGVMPFKKKKKAKLSLSFPKWYWENVSSEAKDFVQCLLKVSPNDRYSSSQLLQHSWFKEPLQNHTDQNLSEMLMEHLNAQAKLKVAAVLILTETALSPSVKQQNKRKVLSLT